MVTIADLQAQQTQALAIIDQKIVDAIQAQNTAAPGQAAQLVQVTQNLQNQRQAIFSKTITGIDGSPEMATALAALSAATANMKSIAAQMTSATTIINQAASFIGAAGKVATALGG